MGHDFAKVRDNNLEITYQHPELAVTVAAGRAPNMDEWLVEVRGADVNNRQLGQFSTKREAKKQMRRWMGNFRGREEPMGLGLGGGEKTNSDSSLFGI